MDVRLQESEDDLAVLHEINVTPFIDVILVLLIIFMIAAPLATVDVEVNLPTSNAAPRTRPPDPVFVTVKADLSLLVGQDVVPNDGLGEALDRATHGDKQQVIYLRADKSVSYGSLTGVMDSLRDASYLRVGLVGLESSAPP
jgi:biopolymer transport protein ExbD